MRLRDRIALLIFTFVWFSARPSLASRIKENAKGVHVVSFPIIGVPNGDPEIDPHLTALEESYFGGSHGIIQCNLVDFPWGEENRPLRFMFIERKRHDDTGPYSLHPDECVSIEHWSLPVVLELHRKSLSAIWKFTGCYVENVYPGTFVELHSDHGVCVGRDRSIRSSLGLPRLPSGQSRINNDGHQSGKFKSIAFTLSCFLLLIAGIALLANIWGNRYFDLATDMDVPRDIALLITCACVIWLGMGFVGHGLGLL